MTQLIERDKWMTALGLAREAFARLDPEAQALRCGGKIVPPPVSIEIPCFDLRCVVSHPEGSVRVEGQPGTLPPWEQVLLLHYLSSTAPVPREEDPIPFSSVPSGVFYDAAFQRRVRKSFLSTFAAKPDLLASSAAGLGGRAVAGPGDVTVTIPAFPRITLTFTLWKADEEFPADMSLLLSSTIAAYLPTEDIAVLGGLAAARLAARARLADSRNEDL
jgi:hypothetical protein